MQTTPTKQNKLGGELTDYCFRGSLSQRQQLQAIALHNGWSEAEAMRRAVSLFLLQNKDLLQVLSHTQPNGKDA